MCNLYSMTTAQDAIRQIFEGITDNTGNLAALPGIYPDTMAPVVRNGPDGPELTMMRWGMPSPRSRISASGRDPGLTNIRNTASGHWRRWLGVENRCVVPMTSFCEPGKLPDWKKGNVWFALDESRPLAFFAGIWTQWTSIRKVKEGKTTDELYGFLTTDANAVVKPHHPRAMPVILTSRDEVQTWLTAPTAEALALQRPLPDDALTIVAYGARQDEGSTLLHK
ncbi:SOS response-associated peptidase [uncultured Roseobacter sp.]|uniref:SOS response-associated peptidase n=1 Tax=uncultured Roseobacter sp. TaxID=114847 RepID=UPI00262165F6|nr:SOS response-associated peptidase [uncultured Roseobacter sp.]